MSDPALPVQPARVFDADSYRAFLKRADPPLAEYRARLPVHLLARCPFCARAIVEPVDTLSLNGPGWGQANAGLGWSGSLGLRRREFDYCDHLRIIAFFLNLGGRKPDDLFLDKRILSGSEVPSLMRVPLRVPDMRVVMHRLPVGRFDDSGSPYALYFLSYFSADDAAFDAMMRAWDTHYGLVDYDDIDYDLAAGAAQGRLLWLDPGDPELPLVGSDRADFPYGHIEGDRSPHRVLTRSGIEHPGEKRRQSGLLSRMLRRWRN